MKDEGPKVGARASARLLRLARERGEDFQLVLLRYAHERLLYRLAASRHAGQFVLKGAALFTVWTGHPHRATRDLDFLAFGDPGEDRVRAVFAELAAMTVEDDGVAFAPSSIDVGPIREAQEYGGVRVRIEARVTSAVVRLQVDIGFGDVITPGATEIEFPALLDFPAPRLRAYPRETVVAEKLEAMSKLGLANSAPEASSRPVGRAAFGVSRRRAQGDRRHRWRQAQAHGPARRRHDPEPGSEGTSR